MNTTNLTWVSPYSPDDARGGWKSMQFHLLRALEQRLGPATRIAPVNVPEHFVAKWCSRLQKKLRLPRSYPYYSKSRLRRFADAIRGRLPSELCAPIVFFGALPFVECRPAGPYYVYTDGAFFIHYWDYNQDHSHADAEIERICQVEALFLRKAKQVWCSSQWVADRIASKYHLSMDHVLFVGAGPGDVPAPIGPVRYENFFVMLAADFERKGGRFAVDLVAALREKGLDWCIKFIGAKPPVDILDRAYVEWSGWLDLGKLEDRGRFATIMSSCAAQILASKHDLTPLAILEASLYAKPTFASRVGGIPEMILDGETGILFETDETVGSLAERLLPLLQDKDALKVMGEAASSRQKAEWNWPRVAERIVRSINKISMSGQLC